MSEALPMISALHLGQITSFKLVLWRISIILLHFYEKVGHSLACLTHMVAIEALEDSDGRLHLSETNLKKEKLQKF